MESGQMYIGSDRRNQQKEPISVPRRIRRLVFRGFGTRMTEGTRETGSFGPGSTNTPFGFIGGHFLKCVPRARSLKRRCRLDKRKE